MNYRILGRTGLRVGEVGFGAWAIGGNSYGPTNDDESRAAVRRALEMGCNFFDTADVYGFGRSEEILGEVLQGQDVIIATKVGGNFYRGSTVMDFSPGYIDFALEQSLRRLRRDYIDLYQLHNPPLALIRRGEVFDALERLKAQGKIRFYGVSVFTAQEGIAAIETGRSDTLQVAYNIFTQEPSLKLFPLARERNIGIIAREPLANGLLTGKYQADSRFPSSDIRHLWPRDYLEMRVKATAALRFLAVAGQRTLAQAAIRYVLDNDAVAVTIPGAKTAAQVEENVKATTLPPLTPEEMGRIVHTLFYFPG